VFDLTSDSLVPPNTTLVDQDASSRVVLIGLTERQQMALRILEMCVADEVTLPVAASGWTDKTDMAGLLLHVDLPRFVKKIVFDPDMSVMVDGGSGAEGSVADGSSIVLIAVAAIAVAGCVVCGAIGYRWMRKQSSNRKRMSQAIQMSGMYRQALDDSPPLSTAVAGTTRSTSVGAGGYAGGSTEMRSMTSSSELEMENALQAASDRYMSHSARKHKGTHAD
jgi:hypothetical protein